jgi:pimeloyl-ACP methyl ester carboxylesterase
MTIKPTPQFHSAPILYKGKIFQIEYFIRPGSKGTIVMLHGLGGCKENYYEACKSDALEDYTLVSFDNPGTGNSTYFEDMPLNVDDLAAISALFIDHLNAGRFILCGTSMGGLTTLILQLQFPDCRAFCDRSTSRTVLTNRDTEYLHSRRQEQVAFVYPEASKK